MRTTGAVEEEFKIGKKLRYNVIDVGGCRSQRCAWAQFFEDATAIIFVAPLSAFDEVINDACLFN